MHDDRGPISYEYLKSSRGAAVTGAVEFPLFTDAPIMGEVRLGPYYLMNPVAGYHRAGYFRPAIVLRCDTIAFKDLRGPMDATDTSRYHGGTLSDELAALASLLLGIRLRAGSVNREFVHGGDPLGRPVAFDLKPWPQSRSVAQRLTMPWSADPCTMTAESLGLIDVFDRVTPRQARALLKAARTYQEALWIAEWEPERSWLLFVAAVEAVSDYATSAGETDAQLLEAYNPSIARPIRQSGGDALLEKLAPVLRTLFGSTRKFCDFIEQHFPHPPNRRPQPNFAIMWTVDTVRPMLKSIYGHRSRALHDGTPFPMPMCQPPIVGDTSWTAAMEMPMGLAASGLQGTWLAEDTPMHLHIFEYIVRSSIVNWWTSRLN